MQSQFIPKEEAIQLRRLGFDHKCLAWYFEKSTVKVPTETRAFWQNWNGATKIRVSAPLWQQVFDWFRERYQYEVNITKQIEEDTYGVTVGWEGVEDSFSQTYYKTYQQARIAAIRIMLKEAAKKS